MYQLSSICDEFYFVWNKIIGETIFKPHGQTLNSFYKLNNHHKVVTIKNCFVKVFKLKVTLYYLKQPKKQKKTTKKNFTNQD